jgi:hypothetical protein
MAFKAPHPPPFHLAHYQSDILRKTCAMLSRNLERPCGFLELSGISVRKQNMCGVSERACTPDPRGVSGHA